MKNSQSPFSRQSAAHSCSRAMSLIWLTMFPSSAWHSPSEEQEHLAGPETQSVQGSSVVVVEKVAQERGKPVA